MPRFNRWEAHIPVRRAPPRVTAALPPPPRIHIRPAGTYQAYYPALRANSSLDEYPNWGLHHLTWRSDARREVIRELQLEYMPVFMRPVLLRRLP